MVQSLCKRFSYCEDAFQWGCVGLVKAIRRFDETKRFQFSTFAVPVILGEMKKARDHTLGWRARVALKKARDFQNQRFITTGKMPSVKETAAYAGLPPEELAMLLEQDQGPVYDDTGRVLSSLPDPDSERWLVRLCITDILSRMPREESWLIRQRFILGRSQSDIAAALSVRQTQISRREKQARRHFCDAWREEN